ncbi:hypothetical protein [Mycobacterium alsense]|uniref:hypothetical protein n=1 Tax=Mycobacterium alsense TaxID=324058 RepID=UPI0021F31BC4|nr:hypothetical protein [Mycobacterium alsense]
MVQVDDQDFAGGLQCFNRAGEADPRFARFGVAEEQIDLAGVEEPVAVAAFEQYRFSASTAQAKQIHVLPDSGSPKSRLTWPA